MKKTSLILISFLLVSGLAMAQPGEPDQVPNQPGENMSENKSSILPDLSGEMLPGQAANPAVTALNTIGESFSNGLQNLGERLSSALS